MTHLSPTSHTLPRRRPGVGFKPHHAAAIARQDHGVGWFEIHAENYMVAGGPMRRLLATLAEHYPISCHGVGLSLGGEAPLDTDHLNRLAALVAWLRPAMVSEHLAWCRHGGAFFNDLLPLPYTRAMLRRVVDHVDHVQEALGRQILIENPATYLRFPEQDMSETTFITELVARTGCGLLLDLNNVHVSAVNHGFDAAQYISELPLDAVGEIHLAGHRRDRDEGGALLLIDSHDRPVDNDVWRLYRAFIGDHGPLPTLIEWDGAIPDWPELAAEAAKASAILNRKVGLNEEVYHVAR